MKYGKITATVLVVSVLSVCGYFAYAATVISIDEDELYQVVSVLDGDTFKAQIGKHLITVRMLGIDTPETVDPRKPAQCYGPEASNESKRLLVGHSVRMKLNPNREERDRYNRYLAYVYLSDGTFMNEYLIENGFAREYTFGTPYVYQTEFRQIEKAAKEAKVRLCKICEDASSKSAKP